MSRPSSDSRFERAVREHAGLAARIAASYERDPHRVDDLVQDVFVALWRALPSFRGDASLATFLARIAHNVCVSHVRRAVREPLARAPAIDPDALDASASPADHEPPRQAEQADRRAALMKAVRALPLPLRQVVTLHLEGFSGPEIASALEITENNVAVRLTRARAALRERLGAHA